MDNMNKKKLSSLILLVDFQKAFDSLSHSYIQCYETIRVWQQYPQLEQAILPWKRRLSHDEGESY